MSHFQPRRIQMKEKHTLSLSREEEEDDERKMKNDQSQENQTINTNLKVVRQQRPMSIVKGVSSFNFQRSKYKGTISTLQSISHTSLYSLNCYLY